MVPITASRTTALIQALEDDKYLSLLIKMIKDGWTVELTEISPRKHWTFLEEFFVYDDIPFRGDRIVIQRKLVVPMLKVIHLGHLGIQDSLSIARENVYRVGVNKDVTMYVKQCKVCQ